MAKWGRYGVRVGSICRKRYSEVLGSGQGLLESESVPRIGVMDMQRQLDELYFEYFPSSKNVDVKEHPIPHPHIEQVLAYLETHTSLAVNKRRDVVRKIIRLMPRVERTDPAGTWNRVLAQICKADLRDMALKAFSSMNSGKLSISLSNFSDMLDVLLYHKDTKKALAVWQLFAKARLEVERGITLGMSASDVVSAQQQQQVCEIHTKFLQLFASGRSRNFVEYIDSILREMERRSWEVPHGVYGECTLLLARTGRVRRAAQLFEQFLGRDQLDEADHKMGNRIARVLMLAFDRLGDARKILDGYQTLLKHDIEPTPDVARIARGLLVKYGKEELVEELFGDLEMGEGDRMAIASQHVRDGDVEGLERVFAALKEEDRLEESHLNLMLNLWSRKHSGPITPARITFLDTLLHNYMAQYGIIPSGFLSMKLFRLFTKAEPSPALAAAMLTSFSKHQDQLEEPMIDAPVVADMIEMFMECGCLEHGEMVFQWALEKNVYPSLILYHSVLEGYGKAGDLDRVESLLDEMEEKSIRFSSKTLAILADAYGRHGDPLDVKEISDLAKYHRISSSNQKYGNALVVSLARSGAFVDALRTLGALSLEAPPTRRTFTDILALCREQDRTADHYSVLQLMRAKSHRPLPEDYIYALEQLQQKDQVTAMRQLLEQMTLSNVRLNGREKEEVKRYMQAVNLKIH